MGLFRLLPGLRPWPVAVLAALGPVLFLPGLVDAYVLPRTTLVVAGACLTLAISVDRPALGRLRWPALALVAAAIAACLASISPALSLIGAYTRYEGLVTRLAYVGLFAGAASTLDSTSDRTRVLRLYTLGCFVAAVEAVWESLTHSLARPDGNLGQPGLLGALLAMALPIAVWLGLRERRPLGLVWAGSVPVLAAGLIVCTSRAGWLGAVAGLAMLGGLAFAGSARASGRRRRALLAGMAATGLLGACSLLLLTTPVRSLNNDLGLARVHVWRDTLSLIAARPLTGWGEDTMGLIYSRYATGDWEPGHTFDRAHNAPLDLAASQGLAGLATSLWFWMLFWWGIGSAAQPGSTDSRRTNWPSGAVAGGNPTLRRSGADEPPDAVPEGQGVVVDRWIQAQRPESILLPIGGALVAYLAWSLLSFDWAPATGMFWLLAGTGWSAAKSERRPAFQGEQRLWTIPAIVGLGLATIAFAILPLAADMAYYQGNLGLAHQLDPLQPRYQRPT